jgi:cytochrome c
MKPNTRIPASRLGGAIVVGCITLSASALTPARAQNVDDQLKKYGCVACHAVDKKVVGPSFKDVAAKFRGQAGAESQLVARIKNGSSGAWGSIPMPPNPSVPDADLSAIVKWILSQKEASGCRTVSCLLRLAQALSRHGIHVDRQCDGDDMDDGELTVAPNVHVRVPTFGEPPCVVVDAFRAELRCYPPRTHVAELARDIRDALDELPTAFASCSIH